MQLRLTLQMNHFQFAKKLGVSEATVQSWEAGLTPTSFEQTKLDGVKNNLSGYFRDKVRLAETIKQHEADKQKSEYVIGMLPDGKGIVAVKK